MHVYQLVSHGRQYSRVLVYTSQRAFTLTQLPASKHRPEAGQHPVLGSDLIERETLLATRRGPSSLPHHIYSARRGCCHGPP